LILHWKVRSGHVMNFGRTCVAAVAVLLVAAPPAAAATATPLGDATAQTVAPISAGENHRTASGTTAPAAASATDASGAGGGVAAQTTVEISFEDQATDGTSVVVSEASNDEAPFYVAVWTVEETEDGLTPDELLGFVPVDDTSTSDLTVDLATPVEENQTLVAAVHPDEDGDATTTDDPVVDTILASDTANVTVQEEPVAPEGPSVTFEDQTTDGTNVTVANASNETAPFYVAVWTVNETDGNATDGNVTDGNVTDGNVTDGNVTDGNVTDGNATDGNVTDGNATDGNVTDGNATDGNATDGNVTDGDGTEGNATDGDVTDGNETDGDVTDGNETDGNVTDGNEADGDVTEGNATDGNATDGVQPETLLGFVQVTNTSASNLTVAFDDPVVENQTLVAAVHPDADGNASTTDPDVDTLLATDTANVTVEGPAVRFEVQTTDGSNVTVAGARNDSAPFYTAVWTTNETENGTLAPETLLGAVQVNDTVGTDLSVAFEEPIAENQTLVAAVHPDADGNATTGDDPVIETILASDTAAVTVETGNATDGNATDGNATDGGDSGEGAEDDPPAEATIDIDEQVSPDGSLAVVTEATSSQTPFYAAVWTAEETADGSVTPGRLLGFTQVGQSSASEVTVLFLEPLVEDQRLIAAVHPDADGDIGTSDDPVAETILAADAAAVEVQDADPAVVAPPLAR
jgi:hypothetical protein